MQIDLLNIEINPTDSQFGASVLGITNIDGGVRSLLGFYWIDRECYLSLLYFTAQWVCLWGWKDAA